MDNILEFSNPVVSGEGFSLESITPEEGVVIEETPIVEEAPEVIIPEESTEIGDSASIANWLQEQSLLEHVPDDVDLENFDKEALAKTLKFNQDVLAKSYYEKGATDRTNQIIDKLPDAAKKILSYGLEHPNADDADILNYLGSLNSSNRIVKLNPEKDAELIVREYYRADEWKQEDIDDKIIELVSANSLVKEATRVKPRLDQKAASIVKEQEDQLKAIQDYELGMQNSLKEKITPLIQAGKIDELPLSQEDVSFLYNAITNNDTAVSIGGKKITMGWAEALVRHNKYSDKGDIKNLALGLLVMYKGPDAIKNYYAKQATTKESEKVLKEHKFSSKGKVNATAPITKDSSGHITFTLGSFK
jgi:hypothetical protein